MMPIRLLFLPVLLLSGCALLPPAEVEGSADRRVPAASVREVDARAAAFDAFAQRVRAAPRGELALEWARLEQEPAADRRALLLLLPQSPRLDERQGLLELEQLPSDERRRVLEAWSGVLLEQRRQDERLREQVAQALERQRGTQIQVDRRNEQLAQQLADVNRRLAEATLRAEAATLRADQLALQVQELQRTLAALREIDRRLNQR